MGQWMRLKTLLAANVNALVEQAENPGRMLRLLIRQMEEADHALSKDITRASEQERRLKARATDAASDLEVGAIKDQLDRLDSELRTMCQQQLQLEDHLQNARRSLAALESGNNPNTVSTDADNHRGDSRLDRKMARTEARMRRFHQRLDGMEAEVEAFDLMQSRRTTGAGA